MADRKRDKGNICKVHEPTTNAFAKKVNPINQGHAYLIGSSVVKIKEGWSYKEEFSERRESVPSSLLRNANTIFLWYHVCTTSL